MASTTSAPEMRKMQMSDLLKEISDLRGSIAKMSMGLALRSEKNSAEFRRQKRSLARLLTIVAEKNTQEPAMEKKASSPKKTALSPRAKRSKVSAPAK